MAMKVLDVEFREIVVERYRKLKKAVEEASRVVLERQSPQNQAVAWRLVDDRRAELLEILDELCGK